MNADVTAKAMDYTLRRWAALTIHLSDARIPVDNNAVENAIRPLALGRKNWLFVGSQQAGERAAVLMTLIESAKLNGIDAWVYLKDVLTKLPTWPNSRLQELLPHRWVPPETASTTTPALVNTCSLLRSRVGLTRAYPSKTSWYSGRLSSVCTTLNITWRAIKPSLDRPNWRTSPSWSDSPAARMVAMS